MRLSRKIKTETEPAVYIPPLNLRGNDASDSLSRPNRSKEHFNFFKAAPLDQNADFLREKSLYRYAISRKGTRNSVNKSHANLVGGKDRLNKTEDTYGVLNKSISGTIKQKQSCYETIKEGSNKGPHFRRKTLNQMYSSYAQLPNMGKTVEVDPSHQGQLSQIQKLDGMLLKSFESQSTSEMNISQDIPKHLKEIQKQLQVLREQNEYLRTLLQKKCEELEAKQIKMSDCKKENRRLLEEVRRNCKIHSDSFINESKLENQLKVKDTMILQLADKLKYLELQNITLKRCKNDKMQQEGLIMKLQKKNRNLQEKIRILTIKTKRHHLTGSMISQFSDLSLNLSADDDETSKSLYPELKTAEKTPEKKKGQRTKSIVASSRDKLAKELASALWQQKMRA